MQFQPTSMQRNVSFHTLPHFSDRRGRTSVAFPQQICRGPPKPKRVHKSIASSFMCAGLKKGSLEKFLFEIAKNQISDDY